MVARVCSGDELRQQRWFGLQRYDGPEGEGGQEGVPEDQRLTLDA